MSLDRNRKTDTLFIVLNLVAGGALMTFATLERNCAQAVVGAAMYAIGSFLMMR